MREFAPRCAWYTKNDGERDGCLSVSPRLISAHPVRRCGNRQARVKRGEPHLIKVWLSSFYPGLTQLTILSEFSLAWFLPGQDESSGQQN